MAFYTLCCMSLECGSNVVRCVYRWNLITCTKIKKPSHYGGHIVDIMNRVLVQIPFLFHHINMVIIDTKVSNEFHFRNYISSWFPVETSKNYHFNVLLKLPQHPPLPPKIKQRKKRKKDGTFHSLNFWKKKYKVKTPPLASNLDSFIGINVHWSSSEHTTSKLTWISSSHRYITSSGKLPIPT